jgi:hypothetical protein
MKHLLLILLVIPFISFSQCPDGSFTSQAEIDALATDYPDCTTLYDFIIEGEDITDLSGLYQITGAHVFVISNNPLLQSLDGLNPNIVLYYVEGQGNSFSINNNAVLTEISGLENLVNQSGFESGFSISDNPMLTSLEGVPNIFNTLTWLTISNNDALLNLIGLENYSPGEYIYIEGNDSLVDLTGLGNYGSEVVIIDNNMGLLSLNGSNLLGFEGLLIINNQNLSDISAIGENIVGYPQQLTISNNPNLSICNTDFVCQFIYIHGFEEGEWFPGTFENNASGCNSNMEVEYACQLNSIDNCGFPEVSDYLILGETIQANNEFATTSFEIPSCNEVEGRQDVWFLFDSGENTSVDVFVGTGFNIQMWEGYCGNELTQIENACNSESITDVTVTPNSLYYLQVWSDPNRSLAGWFNLTVQDGLLSTPENILNEISVYPNPIQNLLKVKSNNTISSINVYNVLGQRVDESQPNAMETQIDLSSLQSGLFLVEITIGKQKTTYKIVKQ